METLRQNGKVDPAIVMALWEARKAAHDAEVAAMESARDTLLTLAECAKRAGINISSVKTAVRQKRLPAIVVTPPDVPRNRRVYRVRAGDLADYIERALKRTPPRIIYDPDAVKQANAEGYLTITQAAVKLGVCRTRIMTLIGKKRLSVVQREVKYIAQPEVDLIISQRALQSLDALP